MISGDLLSAFPHRQFHTLPGLLDSWAALPNSNPNACMPMQGGSLYHFYDGLWYDPAERRSRTTVREADTLPTEPTRHGKNTSTKIYVIYLCIINNLPSDNFGNAENIGILMVLDKPK